MSTSSSPLTIVTKSKANSIGGVVGVLVGPVVGGSIGDLVGDSLLKWVGSSVGIIRGVSSASLCSSFSEDFFELFVLVFLFLFPLPLFLFILFRSGDEGRSGSLEGKVGREVGADVGGFVANEVGPGVGAVLLFLACLS